MIHRESGKPMHEAVAPLLIRYIDGRLGDGGPQPPSSCVIVWDTAVHGPVPQRVEPPISRDLRRIISPSDFRLLPTGSAVLGFRRGTWWGAIVVQVNSTTTGLQPRDQQKHPGKSGR